MEPAILQKQIYNIRNQHVMLDYDLVAVYGMETKRLKEAVKRNMERFPYQLIKTSYF